MFEFVFDDVPPTTLVVQKAEITLFGSVPPYKDRIGLYVEITAEPKTVAPADEPDDTFEIQPRFYTEWLDIPISALRGKGLDLLDGYTMNYASETEAEDGFDQHPGAIYQDSHAGFSRATMVLEHIAGAEYRVRAEGKTEFDWTFRIDTPATLIKIAARSTVENGDKAPSPAVENWYSGLFDPAVFPATWSRKGSDTFNWYVFEGKPALR